MFTEDAAQEGNLLHSVSLFTFFPLTLAFSPSGKQLFVSGLSQWKRFLWYGWCSPRPLQARRLGLLLGKKQGSGLYDSVLPIACLCWMLWWSCCFISRWQGRVCLMLKSIPLIVPGSECFFGKACIRGSFSVPFGSWDISHGPHMLNAVLEWWREFVWLRVHLYIKRIQCFVKTAFKCAKVHQRFLTAAWLIFFSSVSFVV